MSKKDPWYRQCIYEMSTPQGRMEGASWIPETLAKVGKKIYFGKKENNPKILWTVTSVGNRQKESFLMEHRMGYKHQRKVSDI